MTSPPLPAHRTKHVALLDYPVHTPTRRQVTLQLAQRADGRSNGTALWLGAQCLSAYLADLKIPLRRHRGPGSPRDATGSTKLSIGRRPRAVELGSGIGLTALTLAALGWDVLATDINPVVSSVLRPNIHQNIARVRHEGNLDTENPPDPSLRYPGSVQVKELDWSVSPDDWRWNDSFTVASKTSENTNATEEGLESPQTIPTEEEHLTPPFELIYTADTVYSSDLVAPLLRTLHYLAAGSSTHHNPLILVALENRDPTLVSTFLSSAQTDWHFTTHRVPQKKLHKALAKSGLATWDKEDWSDVEIWEFRLHPFLVPTAPAVPENDFAGLKGTPDNPPDDLTKGSA